LANCGYGIKLGICNRRNKEIPSKKIEKKTRKQPINKLFIYLKNNQQKGNMKEIKKQEPSKAD
jgi:hypothetical protein